MPNSTDITQRPRIRQVCVIPLRRRDSRLEFCLITSLRKRRWIFPKGIVERGETFVDAARKEAWEEAGVRGRLVGSILGQFEDRKWGAQLLVDVVVMEVEQSDPQWTESSQRSRRWVQYEDAQRMVRKPALKRFLETAFDLLG